MKQAELKQRTWQAWVDLNEWQGQLLQPETFAQEMRSIGDRRYKTTWIKALARFEAIFAHQSCLDAYSLILYSFNFKPDRWDYEFRHEIMDAFLQYADGLELIKLGLEQIFSNDFTSQDRHQANGFFTLVAEQQKRNLRLATQSLGGSSGDCAATAAGGWGNGVSALLASDQELWGQ